MYKYIAFFPSEHMKKPKTAIPSTRMLNKKQVLERVGVSPNSPYRHDVLAKLTEYKNPHNSLAKYREDEVALMLNSFKEA